MKYVTNPKPVSRFGNLILTPELLRDSKLLQRSRFLSLSLSPPSEKIKSQPVNNQEFLFVHKHLPLINWVCSLNFPGCPSADGQHKVFGGLSCLPPLLHSAYTYRSLFRNKSVWLGAERGIFSPTGAPHSGSPQMFGSGNARRTQSAAGTRQKARILIISSLLHQVEMETHRNGKLAIKILLSQFVLQRHVVRFKLGVQRASARRTLVPEFSS